MKKILLSCVLTALLTVVAPSAWAQPYNWKGTSDVSISSLKLDQNTETLAADKTILTSDLPVQRFDPDGVDRNVTLPAEASSTDLTFFIYNAANGAGEDLTIKNDTHATIVTLGPGMGMMFTCDGTNWVAIGDDGIVYDAQADTISFGSSEITTTGAANAATLNTGQGDNELYAMDQDVKTTDSPAFVTTDLTGVTDGNIPYMQAAGAGFGDSPLSRTDADTLTFQSTTGKPAILNLYSDAAEDNSDKWRVQVADGGNVTLESYATGAWVAVATWTNAGGLTMTGNVAGATYASDGSVSDAELKYINSLSSNAQDQLDARCLESVFGTAIGTGLVLDTSTLKTHAALQSIAGLTETNGGLLYGTADDTYAWLAAGTANYLLQGNGAGAPSWTNTPVIPYKPVLSKTADYVVTTSDFGKSIRFSHASTTGTMTLPSVGATNDGARITFVKTGVARLVIDAADSDLIYDSSAGGTIYSDSAYATLTLEYVDGITAWVIISAVGTWTTT